MLDMGANGTFIDEDLALELKLPIIRTQTKTLNYLDNEASMISNEVQFELVSQTDLSIVTLRGWTVKDLAIRTGCFDWYTQKDQFDYLANIPIPSLPKPGKVSIIIGTNYPGLFKQLNEVHHKDYKTKPEFPMAIQYQLGWSIIGPNFTCYKNL